MTRTGKSNTVKKIIQATVELSEKSKKINKKENADDNLNSFTENGIPKYPVGQIIFKTLNEKIYVASCLLVKVPHYGIKMILKT